MVLLMVIFNGERELKSKKQKTKKKHQKKSLKGISFIPLIQHVMGIIKPLQLKQVYFMAIKTYHENMCKQISWPFIDHF